MEDEGGRSPADLLGDFPVSFALLQEVEHAVSELGDVEVETSKSQIAFRRRRQFAYVWRPGQYVASDVPLVLSVALPYKLASERFKEVAHPSERVWMHHLELRAAQDVDEEVRGWLAAAYANAG